MALQAECDRCGLVPADTIYYFDDGEAMCLDCLGAEVERLRAENAELHTAQWYWDDRNLESAVPADELGDYDDVGDIIEVRPIHELPAVFVLIREDGPYIFATKDEAEQAGGGK